jgi:hypothetical protein
MASRIGEQDGIGHGAARSEEEASLRLAPCASAQGTSDPAEARRVDRRGCADYLRAPHVARDRSSRHARIARALPGGGASPPPPSRGDTGAGAAGVSPGRRLRRGVGPGAALEWLTTTEQVTAKVPGLRGDRRGRSPGLAAFNALNAIEPRYREYAPARGADRRRRRSAAAEAALAAAI